MELDLDSMLYEDMIWLLAQTSRPVNEFLQVASKIVLRNEDWSEFWKRLDR